MILSEFRIAAGTRLYCDNYKPGETPRPIARIEGLSEAGVDISTGFTGLDGNDSYGTRTTISEQAFAKTYTHQNGWLLRM
ncbi:MAG: hypothetical protein GC137_09300 [Alphaproteobacteria bacterium]|nr:hypothetical protein [Alphaproteobacteria bacterium]